MRLFIAVPLPESAATHIAEQLHAIRPLAPQLRWMEAETWHLTLQFLGNVNPDRAQPLIQHLAAVRQPSIPIRFTRLECFERAGALVAVVRPSPNLNTLQASVTRQTSELGFAQESRPFTPHVTLGRWKGTLPRNPLNALNNAAFTGEFTARQFALFQSFTESSGARYEILGSYPLT